MVAQTHVGLVHCMQQLLHCSTIVIGQDEEKQRYACGNKRELMFFLYVIKERSRERARTETVNEQHESCINDPSATNRGTIAGESQLDPQVEKFSIEFVARECLEYRRRNRRVDEFQPQQ